MSLFMDWEYDLIRKGRVARLATVDADNKPHVVPVVYAFEGMTLYTPVDQKPKKSPGEKLKRLLNIEHNSSVTLIVDEYSEDWSRLWWIQIRGIAEIISENTGTEYYKRGIELLVEKYDQYQEMPLSGNPVIVINPVKVVSWKP